jgi:hypothetical protein
MTDDKAPSNAVLEERIHSLKEGMEGMERRTMDAFADMKASNSRDHTAVREMIQEAVSRADMRFENGMETFERKETIRPFKRAVYWIYGLFTTSILSAVVAWVTGKA